jgi:monoamine oxidase
MCVGPQPSTLPKLPETPLYRGNTGHGRSLFSNVLAIAQHSQYYAGESDRSFTMALGNGLTRRQFIAAGGAATASVLWGCGGSNSASPIPAGDEVIILGAGWAGIGAALALKKAGRPFRILEARDRPGGRCFCDNSFAAPFDFGAQFFHQCIEDPNHPGQSTNVLLNLALSMGVTAIPDLFDRLQLDANDNPMPLEAVAQMGIEFLEFDATVENRGRAAAFGAPDESVEQATASLRGQTYYEFSKLVQCGERGLPADEVSSLALYEFARYTSAPIGTPSTDNWVTEMGMGNFLLMVAAGLPIELSTPVSSIDTTGSTVKVQTAAGTIETQAVIVTASVGLLAAGKPAFTPGLPVPYLQAVNDLKMGNVAKVAFEFSEDVFAGLEDSTFITGLPRPGEGMIATMFSKYLGNKQCFMIFGGAPCRELELQGEGALLEYGREVVRRYAGANAVTKITRGSTHSWLQDPWAMGSYQMAKPGTFKTAHAQLQTPIDNRIFFAGEAIPEIISGSIHGAFTSGQDAVAKYLAGTHA